MVLDWRGCCARAHGLVLWTVKVSRHGIGGGEPVTQKCCLSGARIAYFGRLPCLPAISGASHDSLQLPYRCWAAWSSTHERPWLRKSPDAVIRWTPPSFLWDDGLVPGPGLRDAQPQGPLASWGLQQPVRCSSGRRRGWAGRGSATAGPAGRCHRWPPTTRATDTGNSPTGMRVPGVGG